MLNRVVKKFQYAINGINYALVTGSSFRVMSLAVFTALCLGVFFNISKVEWIVVILFSSLMLVTELLNTGAEKLCDIFTAGWLVDEIGVIKDVSAGAALVMSIGFASTSAIIFGPRVVELM